MANAVSFLNFAPKSCGQKCNHHLFNQKYLIKLTCDFFMSFLTQEILLGWVNFEARTCHLGYVHGA